MEGKNHNIQDITDFGVTLIVTVVCVHICQTSISQVVLVLSFLQNMANMALQLQLQAAAFRKAAVKFPPNFTSGTQDPPRSSSFTDLAVCRTASHTIPLPPSWRFALSYTRFPEPPPAWQTGSAASHAAAFAEAAGAGPVRRGAAPASLHRGRRSSPPAAAASTRRANTALANKNIRF